MSWDDYDKLYNELLPEVVGRLDPQRDYWPCSPHTPVGDRRDFNNPDSGDAHLWSVWHGKQPFEWYRTCTHRFNSEFGFQSFPEPQTVYTYTVPEDRNITSFVMEHHQRSGIGNSTIIHYMLDWFKLPTSFDMTLWLSQILQGMAIKYAVEHWRRGMPRGMGTLYWQLNDCWQVASWSSVDYFGNWKALHYMARDFFAPLLISGLEDAEQGTVEIHVTSDLMEATDGVAAWTLTDTDGDVLDRGSTKVTAGSRQSTVVETLDLSQWIDKVGIRNLLLWLDLKVDGEDGLDQLRQLRPPQASRVGRSRHRCTGRSVRREPILGHAGGCQAGALGLAGDRRMRRRLFRQLRPSAPWRAHFGDGDAKGRDGSGNVQAAVGRPFADRYVSIWVGM